MSVSLFFTDGSANALITASLSLAITGLALQLLYRKTSESMDNHDSEIMDAGSVD